MIYRLDLKLYMNQIVSKQTPCLQNNYDTIYYLIYLKWQKTTCAIEIHHTPINDS